MKPKLGDKFRDRSAKGIIITTKGGRRYVVNHRGKRILYRGSRYERIHRENERRIREAKS